MEEEESKEIQIKPERIEEIKRVIEASLFMSSNPLSVEEISKTTKCNRPGLIERIMAGLIEEYRERDSAIEIVKEMEGYKMQVKRELEEKIAHLAAATDFNKGVMKTLAYIAYKQPVKQSMIIKFRTNKAYEEIKLLGENGFISREKSGLTYIIRTTKKFLQYFGEDAVRLKENPEFSKE
ncbi:SMC-Scp complex subunit ScpB [Candidatus Micrarchaeota archaeon]|nr:SMC-Scp complex subunit ScpB [Candidatus Micrarchaeota archaeon]